VSRGAPAISVVIPVYDEEDSIARLAAEIDAALAGAGARHEIIFVDDGSRDGTWREISRIARASDHVLGIRLSRNFGQTAALRAGIDRSSGGIIVTMDGDLQNDPADIPKLLARLNEGYEIVSGWRRSRQDKLISRRVPSVVANALVRCMTKAKIHDLGCGLKAYRGELLRQSTLYSDFHRFAVPLTQIGGGRVAEVETHHRGRLFGRSKYGLTRVPGVLADLATLTMITRFSDRPLVWFLAFASVPLLLSIPACVWVLRTIAAPTLAGILVPIGSVVLLAQSFLAIFFQGLLAERIRHLALSDQPHRRRILVTLADAMGGNGLALLIRGGRARRLG